MTNPGYAIIASLVLAFGLSGCGGSIASICDARCECEGCSDAEYEECVDEGEDDERRADREGCLAEFDDWIACIDAEAECRDGDDFEADGCGPERDDYNDCVN